jgi:hypothetical protein
MTTFTTKLAATVAGLLSLSGAAHAGTIYLTDYATDAAMLADLGANRVAVAEGRFGNNALNGDHELNLGPDTSAPAVTGQRTWTKGSPVSFELSYDDVSNLLTFTVGASVLNWALDAKISELYLRSAAFKTGSSVALTNLTLDGQSVGADVIATGPSSRDLLRVRSADLLDGFSFKGLVTFDWDSSVAANIPLRSNAAFQIKMSDAPVVVPLPAPLLAGGVLLASVAGVRMARRRRVGA